MEENHKKYLWTDNKISSSLQRRCFVLNRIQADFRIQSRNGNLTGLNLKKNISQSLNRDVTKFVMEEANEK